MSKKNVHPIVSGAGWIGSFAGMLVEELVSLEVSFDNIHKLGAHTKEGNILVKKCAKMIAETVRGVTSQFLTLISSEDSIVISPVDGRGLLSEAKDIFSYIDSDFRNYGADERGGATGATPVQVYEMSKDATFAQLFGSLSSDLDGLCLTQAQIIEFVKAHRRWLRNDGYGTFFLFKSKNSCFVAYVGVDSGGTLKVNVYQFESSRVWNAEDRHRVVVPAGGG